MGTNSPAQRVIIGGVRLLVVPVTESTDSRVPYLMVYCIPGICRQVAGNISE